MRFVSTQPKAVSSRLVLCCWMSFLASRSVFRSGSFLSLKKQCLYIESRCSFSSKPFLLKSSTAVDLELTSLRGIFALAPSLLLVLLTCSLSYWSSVFVTKTPPPDSRLSFGTYTWNLTTFLSSTCLANIEAYFACCFLGVCFQLSCF